MEKFLPKILDFIFPRHCCICNRYLGDSPYRYLCETCSRGIIFLGSNLCQKCGYDFGEISFHGPKLCPRCRERGEREFRFRALRSAVRLNPFAKGLLHRFKYENGEYLAQDLCKIAQQNSAFMELIGDSIMVPVPLHWRRRFFREYNQSDLLAQRLAKLPIAMEVLPLLKRIRHRRPQVELRASERRTNVENIFTVNPKFKIPFSRKLVVFDDVVTTGATIDECCKTLQKYGFSNIYAATFAQTIKD
ncbi:MAG: ComF family protein [Puniceicoccales bacterium]|jgi:ComF family protein|nr:ComF family protein [Puniceicoccales bacterium]